MKKYLGLLLILTLAVLCAVPLQAAPDFEKILAQLDSMMTFTGRDFSSTMSMESVDPEKGPSKMVVSQFRRDSENKFLMIILEPVAQKGQGYLRIDDNLWMYDPESRKFTHSSMKESFEESDAKNSDFSKPTYAKDYEVVTYTEGNLEKYEVYILDLKGKNNEVTYPFIKMWLRKDNYLVLKMESYSLTKRLMRTAFFPKYAAVGGKYIPTYMIFRDELTAGKKTEIRMSDISIAPLPDKVFTKAYVEQVNH